MISKEFSEEMKKEKGWIYLPFRIIQSRILPFFLFEVESKTKDLALFGVFKKDSSGKVFQIFCSISICKRSKSIVVDTSRLVYLEIKGGFKNSFFGKNNFRLLEYLCVKQCTELTGEDWSNIPDLRGFTAEYCPLMEISRFQKNDFKSLEKLSVVSSSHFITENNIVLSSRNLKKFELIVGYSVWFGFSYDVTDIFFSKNVFSNLEILRLGYCTRLKGKDWNSDIRKSLRKLEIDHCKNFGDDFFGGEELLCLESIFVNYSDEVTGKGWNFMPKIKKLEISYCDSFTDELFKSHEFLELETLSICGSYKIEGKGWNFLKNLLVFEVGRKENCDEYCFEDYNFDFWKEEGKSPFEKNTEIREVGDNDEREQTDDFGDGIYY